MYKDVIDSHMHTLASGHAFNTIKEMIQAGHDSGLEVMAITEHGPVMPGTCHIYYFRNFKILPRMDKGMYTLYGVELNILDPDGHIDMEERDLKKMDVCIASIHPGCYSEDGSDPDKTLKAYIGAMDCPYVNIIGHPDDGRFPIDNELLVKAAKEKHKLIELNNASLLPTSARPNTRVIDRDILEWCKKYDQPIIIDSDTHIDFLVGKHEEAHALLEEIDFPERLVVNSDPDMYFSYINYKK